MAIDEIQEEKDERTTIEDLTVAQLKELDQYFCNTIPQQLNSNMNNNMDSDLLKDYEVTKENRIKMISWMEVVQKQPSFQIRPSL